MLLFVLRSKTWVFMKRLISRKSIITVRVKYLTVDEIVLNSFFKMF